MPSVYLVPASAALTARPLVTRWQPRHRFTIAVAGLLAAAAIAGIATIGMTTGPQFERSGRASCHGAASHIAARRPAWRKLGDNYSGTAMLWLRPAWTAGSGSTSRMEQYTQSELADYFACLLVDSAYWSAAAPRQ